MPLKIALVGASGRTGRAIAARASECQVMIAAAVTRTDDISERVQYADVVLDFSSPEITSRVIQAAIAQRKPLVVGTTGHPQDEKAALLREAAKIPTVWSGNYSVGVNLLFALSQTAASMLGNDYDVEILETHHRFKRDAPSGTAVRLLEIVGSRNRSPNAIGVHAVRGGDVVGDHAVIFAGLGERLELAHKASDRAIFAGGAIRAAHWILAQQPGIYDMQDVLGLK